MDAEDGKSAVTVDNLLDSASKEIAIVMEWPQCTVESLRITDIAGSRNQLLLKPT